jgi:hypothetical protein
MTAVALDHDYGDDATILANFLTADVTLRQQAALTLLVMAVQSGRPLPVVDEDVVDVCAGAILDVTRDQLRDRVVSPARCATLAHLACRAFARHQQADAAGPVAQHALLAIGEAAAAAVMGA